MGNNIFEGERVRLRAVEPEDAKTFVEWDLDSETARTGYFIPPPNSTERASRWAQTESSRDTAGEDDRFRYVIEMLDHTMVGTIMTGECNRRDGTFTYGIGIARPFWRKGFASEAIRLVLRYYFDELRYNKVNAVVYEYNEGSLALHKSLGFAHEGVRRQNHFTDGRYWDEHLFGLTASEFRAAQS